MLLSNRLGVNRPHWFFWLGARECGGLWCADGDGGVAWSGLSLQCGVKPVEDRPVQSQVVVVGALARDDGGPVVLEETQFGFGEPTHRPLLRLRAYRRLPVPPTSSHPGRR